MNHAMAFVGVDVDEDGHTTRRWRVENSWGDKIADKGYFTMSDDWFTEYVYEVAVPKALLPAEYLQGPRRTRHPCSCRGIRWAHWPNSARSARWPIRAERIAEARWASPRGKTPTGVFEAAGSSPQPGRPHDARFPQKRPNPDSPSALGLSYIAFFVPRHPHPFHHAVAHPHIPSPSVKVTTVALSRYASIMMQGRNRSDGRSSRSG